MKAGARESVYPTIVAKSDEMATGRRRPAVPHQASGHIRIIGGRWRGRRLPVADAQGLRPTADRIRETLFNWLQADITGSRCLDLFAGSGALGIEALSRGAAHCTFVDSNTTVLRGVAGTLATLGATNEADCHAQNASVFVASCHTPYDVIFLDPPFATDLLPDICQQLQDSDLLSADTLIYVESGQSPDTWMPDEQWQTFRQKRAGAVHYGLYSRLPGH